MKTYILVVIASSWKKPLKLLILLNTEISQVKPAEYGASELVSRNEEVLFEARKNYYANQKNKAENDRRVETGQFVGRYQAMNTFN